MADEIPFMDPTESEAFPGLLFGLSSTRDAITLGAYDPHKQTATRLVSLDRRGFLLRHAIRSFPACPPTDNGHIPTRDESERERGDRPPTQEPPTINHPAYGLQMRLRGDGGSGVMVQFRSPGSRNWYTAAYFDSNFRLVLAYNDRRAVDAYNEMAIPVAFHDGNRMSIQLSQQHNILPNEAFAAFFNGTAETPATGSIEYAGNAHENEDDDHDDEDEDRDDDNEDEDDHDGEDMVILDDVADAPEPAPDQPRRFFYNPGAGFGEGTIGAVPADSNTLAASLAAHDFRTPSEIAAAQHDREALALAQEAQEVVDRVAQAQMGQYRAITWGDLHTDQGRAALEDLAPAGDPATLVPTTDTTNTDF